jgi:hypothetical protein
MVAVTLERSAPGILRLAFSTAARARFAESSDLTSITTRGLEVEARAARPVAIVPLPAIATNGYGVPLIGSNPREIVRQPRLTDESISYDCHKLFYFEWKPRKAANEQVRRS